jgi:hypothetical protein
VVKTKYTARAAMISGLLALSACSPDVPSGKDATEWHEFHGLWTATGNRQTIPLGQGRHASITDFNGSLVLAGTRRPAVGFGAEALVLSDTATGTVGRAVWTDERGDQVYSELKGDGTATGNRIVGTFLGGTGRYSGATGTYQFSWQFVLETDDGTVQGQSVGLKGRVHFGSSHAPQKSEAPS